MCSLTFEWKSVDRCRGKRCPSFVKNLNRRISLLNNLLYDGDHFGIKQWGHVCTLTHVSTESRWLVYVFLFLAYQSIKVPCPIGLISQVIDMSELIDSQLSRIASCLDVDTGNGCATTQGQNPKPRWQASSRLNIFWMLNYL